MRVLFFCSFSFAAFLQGITVQAVRFECALKDPLEDVLAVRHAVLHSPFPVEASHRRIIISVNHPWKLDHTLENAPQDFGVKGKLPIGIIRFLNQYKTQYFQNISRSIGQDATSTDFVFAGYGHGGKISLVLSALWAHEYERTLQQKPQPNQIKSITFSASSFGDKALNDFLEGLLGKANILDFSSYFSEPTRCGVPIRILPSEQLVDTLRNICSLRSVQYGLIASAALHFATQTCSALTSLEDAGNNLVSESDQLINTSTGLLLSYNLTLPTASVVSYTAARDNFIGVREGSTRAFLTYYSLSVIAFTARNLYKNYHFLPSERLVSTAFQYAQDNYKSDLQADLQKVGQPPLLSFRRGVVGALARFMGRK